MFWCICCRLYFRYHSESLYITGFSSMVDLLALTVVLSLIIDTLSVTRPLLSPQIRDSDHAVQKDTREGSQDLPSPLPDRGRETHVFLRAAGLCQMLSRSLHQSWGRRGVQCTESTLNLAH